MAKSSKKATPKTKSTAASPKATKPVAPKAATAKAPSKKAPSKKAVAKKSAAKKTVKKTVAKKAATKKATVKRHVTAEERRRLIAEAAYLRGESQGFLSDEREDWLQAESEVDALLAKAKVTVRD